MSESALVCDHVAVLVADLDAALRSLGALAAAAHPVEEFPSEGTREVYLGDGRARLLLLESIGPGPYRSALERRGPGLHHVAYAGPDPRRMLAALPGWVLHSFSEQSQPNTLWAYRPGLPLLVELSAGECSGAPWVSGLELACAPDLEPFAARLGDPGFTVERGERTRLRIGDSSWDPVSLVLDS